MSSEEARLTARVACVGRSLRIWPLTGRSGGAAPAGSPLIAADAQPALSTTLAALTARAVGQFRP